MILVPVKNLANAKQRLSSVLGPEARQELAQSMCADVLETLARWRQRRAVAVVTSDLFASNFAEGLGFEVIADDANPGETGAIEGTLAIMEPSSVLSTTSCAGFRVTTKRRWLASSRAIG